MRTKGGGQLVFVDKASDVLQMSASPADHKKFAFMTCVNDGTLYQECLKRIDSLHVRSGCTIEKIAVAKAKSISEAYDSNMKKSDAKFKICLHQDTFIRNKNFLIDICSIFARDPSIGMIGVVGARRLPPTGLCSRTTGGIATARYQSIEEVAYYRVHWDL